MLLALLPGIAGAASLQPEKPARPDNAATESQCDRDCEARRLVDRHLALMGEFNNDRAVEASLRKLVSLGQPAVRATADAYDDWRRAEYTPSPLPTPTRPGEMRWRATMLLGVLGVDDARRPLYDIARHEDLDPRHGEQAYADDHRVKLRAIAGLVQLKAVEELKQLHERGGTLSNATAAALFELGINVGNVRLVDAKTALAEAKVDSRDHKPGKGRPAQIETPGSPRFKVKPRADTPALRGREG
jgi:hypothetical protein